MAAVRARAHEAARVRLGSAARASKARARRDEGDDDCRDSRPRTSSRGRRPGRGRAGRDAGTRARIHLRRRRATSASVAALRTGPSSALGVRALDGAVIFSFHVRQGASLDDRSVGGLARRWGPGARPGAISATARPTARRTPRCGLADGCGSSSNELSSNHAERARGRLPRPVQPCAHRAQR
jgi:hypothetical protein